MAEPGKLRVAPRELVAVVLLLIAGLFLQAWLTTTLDARLGDRDHATNVARLVALPLVFVGTWLVVRNRPRILSRLFAPGRFDLWLLVSAVLLGLVIRIFWWSQATARVAFGIGVDSSPQADAFFSLGYACPAASVVAVAALVWLFLVPVTEEFVHRGILQSAFADRGPVVAIGLSAAIFAVMHPLQNFAFVFLFGIVFGVQYWRSRTLLAPIVTHATYDGLQIVDWICLRIVWRPAADARPLVGIGLAAATVAALALAAVFGLLRQTGRRRMRPRPAPEPR